MDEIKELFKEREVLYSKIKDDSIFVQSIISAGDLINKALLSGGKVLIFGNGGSAAEAQHFAAELVGRFEKNRKALPAIALTTDTSIITAQANDDSFASIFSRQIEALGNEGDVVVGMTTSDFSPKDLHSANILNGFKAAREKNLKSIGLFSMKTKELLNYVDLPVVVPHTNTALIQEVHLAGIHLLCRLIEKKY